LCAYGVVFEGKNHSAGHDGAEPVQECQPAFPQACAEFARRPSRR
jgi:hypothetical protein